MGRAQGRMSRVVFLKDMILRVGRDSRSSLCAELEGKRPEIGVSRSCNSFHARLNSSRRSRQDSQQTFL